MSRSTNARIEKKCKCIIYNCALFVIFCWIHVSLLTCTLGLSNTMFLEAKVQKLHETRVSCIFISHCYWHFNFLEVMLTSWFNIYKIAKGGQRGQSLKYLEACFQCIDRFDISVWELGQTKVILGAWFKRRSCFQQFPRRVKKIQDMW